MMLIKKPYLTRENGQSRLTFPFVDHLGEEKELYFEVESSLEKYLTCDRVDAAVVGLLPDIIRHGGLSVMMS